MSKRTGFKLGLLSLILKSLIKSLMPKAPHTQVETSAMISIASMHIDSYNCLELTQRLVILYPALVLYGIGITYITVHSIPSNTIQSKHLKCMEKVFDLDTI